MFLDRDGTLIVEKHFLRDPDLVQLEAGVIEGLQMLQEAGHSLIVISNQSGIGRGKLTEVDAQLINDRLDSLLRAKGVEILAWYLCPHSPDVSCTCRKPLPGMPTIAAREWQISLPGSYVIGDKRSDIETADAIGGTGILLTTGHGHEYLAWAHEQRRPVFAHLKQAAAYIGERDSRPTASDNFRS